MSPVTDLDADLRLERQILELQRLVDPQARETARAVVAGVLEMHAGALEHVVAVLRARDPEVLTELSAEPRVASVLALHGLGPVAEPPAGSGQHERCELCAAPLADEHDHLANPSESKLRCACVGCALLFDGRPDAEWMRVPRRQLRLGDFQMDESLWASLDLPIALAFFMIGRDGPAAFYPSPAGAIRSTSRLEGWSDLGKRNPAVQTLRSDVEALLVEKLGPQPRAWVVPIDRCYALVGLVRTHWRGFGGGTELWSRVGDFFARLEGVAHA